MSRHEWERGEIKMSVKEFGAVRRDLIASYNANQTNLFAQAKNIYVQLKAAGKGKRGFDFGSAFSALMQNSRLSDADSSAIYDAIMPYVQVEKLVAGQILKSWERVSRPKNPQKKQFAPLKQNAEHISIGGEAGIGFNKKTRVITWHVSENNHAVDRARESAMGREFFKRMSRVEWTRGTGGEIVGNDEYNQDSRDSGGGANYTKETYRMLSAKEKAEKARRYNDSLPSYNPYRGWNSRRGF